MNRHSRHPELHRSERVGWLRAAVLGANDGIVSVAGLVVGVAASGASATTILATGVAGTVAGAMSMAAGEYVSVQTQADTEAADLAMEKRELREDPHSELEELAAIYRHRGLEPALARQVAEQLTAHDALGAHARDELGITDTLRARPLQAALASAGAFTCGAALPVLTGERFEVLVDISDGKPVDLVTLPVSQMGMALPPFDQPHPVLRIQPLRVTASGTLPDTLVNVPVLPDLTGLTQRTFHLSMDPMLDMAGMQALRDKYGDKAMTGMHHGGMMDHMGMNRDHGSHGGDFDFHSANRINGRAFDMNTPLFAAGKGQYERWVISGEGDMMQHPFHIHGTQFRILSENGRPPAAHRAGWKDTVNVYGARSEVLVKFDHDAPKEHAYMAHCHLLEHEDTGMMMGFVV